MKGKRLHYDYQEDKDYEIFEAQTKGLISNSITQNWTPSALDCYKINSCCAVCSITKNRYSFKCKMKEIVDILLKTKGLPDEKAIMEHNREEIKQEIVA